MAAAAWKGSGKGKGGGGALPPWTKGGAADEEDWGDPHWVPDGKGGGDWDWPQQAGGPGWNEATQAGPPMRGSGKGKGGQGQQQGGQGQQQPPPDAVEPALGGPPLLYTLTESEQRDHWVNMMRGDGPLPPKIRIGPAKHRYVYRLKNAGGEPPVQAGHAPTKRIKGPV
jgi:hypothetical protein